MAFSYQSTDRNVTKATRRLAAKRSAHALKALQGGEPAAEALHTARKDTKKLRALLKLIRPAFPGYKTENATLRDAARAVSALRDRTAMLEAFDRVAPGAAAVAFPHIRAALEARDPAGIDEAAEVIAFAEALSAFHARSARWKLRKSGFKALERGLEDGYRSARAAMRTARSRGTAEDFHTWRKAAKAHWYHAGLLAGIAPEEMARHVALAGDLAERLGDHHDLVALAELLPALDVPPAERDAFANLLDAQLLRLERYCFRAGHGLYKDSPGKLVKRWRKWWNRRGD